MTLTDHLNHETGYPAERFTYEQLQARVMHLEGILNQLLEIHRLAVFPQATPAGTKFQIVNMVPQ